TRIWTNQLALAMQIQHANRAVERFKTLLNNELKKLKAGESTLFKYIDFESFLTSAQITQVTLIKEYAQNIGNLGLITGTVCAVDCDLDSIQVNNMTEIPCCVN